MLTDDHRDRLLRFAHQVAAAERGWDPRRGAGPMEAMDAANECPHGRLRAREGCQECDRCPA